MSDRASLYAQIQKVEDQDDGTIKVLGIASSEAEDSDGEVILADAIREAAPDYLKWGAVREMHQPIAAGTAIGLTVGDDNVTHLEAHIVDPTSIKKVRAGVLKGFSVRGPVLKRRTGNPRVIERMKLTEISLVDRPANPEAVIELVKFDEEGRIVPETATKVAERKDVDPNAGKDKYGDVAFADAKNKKYPIDTAEHIRAAWNYINKPKNAAKYSAADLKTIKGKIVAAWKAKIDKDGPPSAAKKFAGALAEGDVAEKGLYDVSNLAQTVQGLYWLQECAEAEAEREGDGSDVPDKLKAITKELGAVLVEMAGEEVNELFDEADDEPIVEVVMAQKASDDAAKATAEQKAAEEKAAADAKVADDAAKAGKTFSKETSAKIGAVHKAIADHAKAMSDGMAAIMKAMDEIGYKEGDGEGDDTAGKSAGTAGDKQAVVTDPGADVAEKVAKLEARVVTAEKERDDAVAKAAEAAKELEKLTAEVQKAMDEMTSRAGAKGALRMVTVAKDEDGGAGTIGKADEKKDETPTGLIRQLHHAGAGLRAAAH